MWGSSNSSQRFSHRRVSQEEHRRAGEPYSRTEMRPTEINRDAGERVSRPGDVPVPFYPQTVMHRRLLQAVPESDRSVVDQTDALGQTRPQSAESPCSLSDDEHDQEESGKPFERTTQHTHSGSANQQHHSLMPGCSTCTTREPSPSTSFQRLDLVPVDITSEPTARSASRRSPPVLAPTRAPPRPPGSIHTTHRQTLTHTHTQTRHHRSMRGGERDPNDADQCRHCEGRGEQTGRPRALHMPPPSHRPINRSSNRQALSGAQLERAVMSRVRTFFRTDGWRFRWIENEPDGPVQLCMGVSGRTMENQQLAVSFEHGSLVLNFPQILFVDRNSDAQVSRVCKGLMHLNRRLLLGSFGLDLRDGEVSFRLSQVVHDGELTDNQLSQMVYMGVRTVDEQMNSLMQLADSSDAVEPRDVIDGVQLEALEGSSESEIEERIAGTDLGVLVRACVEGEEEAMALKNANAERERRDGPGGGRDHEGGPGAGGRWRDHGGDAGGDGGSGGAAAAS